MGRGRRGGGRGGGGGFEDQYGESGISQDRQESFGTGGRGGASGGRMSGGGEAGQSTLVEQLTHEVKVMHVKMALWTLALKRQACVFGRWWQAWQQCQLHQARAKVPAGACAPAGKGTERGAGGAADSEEGAAGHMGQRG